MAVDPISLMVVGGVNPMAGKGGQGGGSHGSDNKGRRRRKNPAPFGKRYTASLKKSGKDALVIAGMLLGNVVAQITRTQVIARMPVGNVAGHAVDLAADWLAVAPLVESIVPGEFGRGMGLGVRFNSVAAAVKTFVPQNTTANRMLGVTEFIPEAPQRPVEAPAPNTGTTAPPGYRYGNVGTAAMPGNQGAGIGGGNVRMRAVA